MNLKKYSFKKIHIKKYNLNITKEKNETIRKQKLNIEQQNNE